ncbi:ubiquinol oxidase subunit II [Candidatus Parcubacteria bacterium]|nr:ubiquinol oxidase subunit II [Candidatus Parcubacteria bacterium]
MKNIEKIIMVVIFCFWLFGLILILSQGSEVSILDPKGQVAAKEKNLLIFASGLSLIIILPVFALIFGIAWRYREGNDKAKYKPDWDHSRLLESIWWGVPFALIVILSIVTYKSSHELDPFKPLEAETKPLTIQVIAMDWKWLFIYPEQNIATVNYVKFPAGTPVNFQLTGDGAMNSFWIPQLGGQIYAMAGMSTQINLLADEPGDFRGSSANISGRGFSDMTFIASAGSNSDFEAWVGAVKKSQKNLSENEYKKLAEPTVDHPPTYYSSVQEGLYKEVILSFLLPS